MELQRKLWKSFLKVGLFKYTSEIVAFLGSMIISRLLIPSEYGVVAMIGVGYLFVARFSNPGYTESVIREGDSESYKSEIQWVFVFHGLLLALIMVLLAFPLTWFFQDDALLYPAMTYGAILFLYALSGASESFLTKKKRFADIFKTELLGTVLSIALTIILAYLGFSYWSLILPHLVIPMVYFYIYRSWEPIGWAWPTTSALKNVISKMRTLVWQLSKVNIIEYWEEQVDNFWVGRLFGGNLLGLYNRAFLVAHLPRALFKPIVNTVLLPEWQRYQKQTEKVGLAYASLVQVILGLLTLPMAITILFPMELSVWLWGKQWAGVAPFLEVLGLVMGFQVVCSTSRAVFILMRQERLYTRYAWLQGILMIATITVTIFYSLKIMVLALVLVTLLVKVPAYAYWCLYRALHLDFRQVINTIALPWLICLLLWFLIAFQISNFMFPLGLLIAWAALTLYQNRKAFLHGHKEKK